MNTDKWFIHKSWKVWSHHFHLPFSACPSLYFNVTWKPNFSLSNFVFFFKSISYIFKEMNQHFNPGQDTKIWRKIESFTCSFLRQGLAMNPSTGRLWKSLAPLSTSTYWDWRWATAPLAKTYLSSIFPAVSKCKMTAYLCYIHVLFWCLATGVQPL